MGPVGICAIFRDEAPDLLEWIAYHLTIGFDHIVLYDNGSSDGGAELVTGSPFAPLVTIIAWPQQPAQLAAYQHFRDTFADRFEWVAFIDIDEFVHPLEHNSIKAVLPRYGDVSSVALQWLTFGSSGHIARPQGLVIEAYDMRLPDDHDRCLWVKPLVRIKDVLDVSTGPHFFKVTGQHCNSSGHPVPLFAKLPPFHDVIVLNHYFTKSAEDWDTKTRRGGGHISRNPRYYNREHFDSHDGPATVRDNRIKRFASLVERALAAPGFGLPIHVRLAADNPVAGIPMPPAPAPADTDARASSSERSENDDLRVALDRTDYGAAHRAGTHGASVKHWRKRPSASADQEMSCRLPGGCAPFHGRPAGPRSAVHSNSSRALDDTFG